MRNGKIKEKFTNPRIAVDLNPINFFIPFAIQW